MGEVDQNIRTWRNKLGLKKSSSETLSISVFGEIVEALKKMDIFLEARAPHGFGLTWKVNQRYLPLPPDHFFRRLVDLESNMPMFVPRDLVVNTWGDPHFKKSYQSNGEKALSLLGADPMLPKGIELSYFDFALYLSAGKCTIESLVSLNPLSDVQKQLLRDLQSYFAEFFAKLEQPVKSLMEIPPRSADALDGVWQIETVEIFMNSNSARHFCNLLFDVPRELSDAEVQRSAEHPANLLMPKAIFEFNDSRENRPEAVRYWRGKITLRMDGDDLVSTTEDFQQGHFHIDDARVTKEGLVEGKYRFVEVNSCGVFYLWRTRHDRMEGTYVGYEPSDMSTKVREMPVVGGRMYCTKLHELPLTQSTFRR